MKLMHYAPIDRLDVVAIWVEGAVSSCMKVVLHDVIVGRKPVFHTWARLRDAMVQGFEPVTEVEEARKEL